MKVSVMSYSFNQQLKQGTVDLFGYLETCKYRYRLGAADLWNGTLASLDEGYLQKVKEGLDERELVLANLAVDGPHLWEDDAAVRQQHYRLAQDYLRIARTLGAQSLRIDAGGPRDALEFTPEQFDLVVRRFREYAQYGSDYGFRVGPENHWGPEKTPGVLRDVCQAVDHPGFGILLHVGRWQGPDSDRGDEITAPWVMHTHVSERMVPDLAQTMRALRDAGYSGYWGIEHPAPGYAEVACAVERVRAILDGWRSGR